VVVDEILPDGPGVPTPAKSERDELAVGLARAGGGRAPGGRRPHQRAGNSRRQRRGVGGHLTGRIWRQLPTPGPPDGDPGRLQVGAGRLPAHPGRLLDAPQRPAQPPECQYLMFFVVAQDVGHVDEGIHTLLAASTSWGATSLAGFQVSTTGRFWVSTEARSCMRSALGVPPQGHGPGGCCTGVSSAYQHWAGVRH